MKNLFRVLSVSALILIPSLSFADAELPDGCLKAYESSTDASIQASKEFLRDSIDDFDYPSIDKMSAAVRAKTGVKAWAKEEYLDVMNVAVTRALEQIADKVCASKPLNLGQIRDLLVTDGLPKYFKANPDDAKQVGWK